MTGKKKSAIKVSKVKDLLFDLIEEEPVAKYLKSMIKQMLTVNKTYTSASGYKVATHNVGYHTIKAHIENMIEKRMPGLIDSALDRYVNRLAKNQLDQFKLKPKTRTKINDKFEDMLLKYLEDLPEKERSKLMMKYLMCR